jgi:hypothetical protein
MLLFYLKSVVKEDVKVYFLYLMFIGSFCLAYYLLTKKELLWQAKIRHGTVRITAGTQNTF